MAELHIERKERTTWPWILVGLLLLALLAWFLFGRGDDTQMNAGGDVAPAGVVTDTMMGAGAAVAAPEAVNDYLRYSDERRARADADLTHEYTADGLRRLAAALGAISAQDAAADAELRPQVDALRERADAIQNDPSAENHANLVREAFVMAGDLMQAMQQRAYPAAGDAVSQVRDAATAVDGSRLLMEQRAETQRFFDAAGQALQTMTGNTPA